MVCIYLFLFLSEQIAGEASSARLKFSLSRFFLYLYFSAPKEEAAGDVESPVFHILQVGF